MSNPTGSILLRRGPTTDRLAFVPLDGEVNANLSVVGPLRNNILID